MAKKFKSTTSSNKASVYDMVTARIITMLESGVIPWRKPWVNNAAVNWTTQKPYRGINTMLLDPGEYATFKQVTEAGGHVKKGQKSHIVVFWKPIKAKDKDSGELTGDTMFLLRYYSVFDINKQCEGLESKRIHLNIEHDPIEEAENILAGYVNGPKVFYVPGRAYYRPGMDIISLPEKNDFPILGEYYSTNFHEQIHSTGHKKRLNRSGIEAYAAFGDENYSKEELIAEIGAAMLCTVAGIDNSTIQNSASYIGSWLRKLKDDPKLIVQAAGQAQRAADHILGVNFEAAEENEEVEEQ